MLAPHVVLVVTCVMGDLAAERPVTGQVERGDPVQVTRGPGPADGAVWDAPGTVILGRGGWILVDLGGPREIRALALQADDNDSYLIEGSLDGSAWTELGRAGRNFQGPGLRTRHKDLDGPPPVRHLRVSGRGGDGHYSIGHLRAYCQPPPDWPGEPSPWNPVLLWRSIDDELMTVIKGCVAGAGALLLLASALLARRGRERVLRRTRDALLAALGIISFCCYFNLFRFHYPEYRHYWDSYHYFIGAKYLPELGHTRLYECTTVAEAEVFGRASVEGRQITDLTTNVIVPAAPVVEDPARCTRHFSAARWQAFRADIAFFRNIFPAAQWRALLLDHGFNATPVWTLTGRLLSGLGSATQTSLLLLGLIDTGLLGLMWAAIAWAFGWRVACVGLLWWGLNYPARFYWNGGAFLRMDWLALAMIGVCLVKRGRPRAGGFALGASALLRIFPAFIFVGLFLQIAVASWRARRVVVSGTSRQILRGAVLAGIILVPLSIMFSTGRVGLASYGAFIENSRKHMSTPYTNSMGLRTVVAYEPATAVRATLDHAAQDPYGPWKEARRRVFHDRLVLHVAALAGVLALLGWAVRRKPEWAALALGAGLIPFAAELSCYYYSFLLAFAFISQRLPLVGAGLSAAAAGTCLVSALTYWDDTRYLLTSIVVLAFIVGALAMSGRDPGNAVSEIPD